jgi:hypothetical protein
VARVSFDSRISTSSFFTQRSAFDIKFDLVFRLPTAGSSPAAAGFSQFLKITM